MTILNRGSQRYRDRTKYNRKTMKNETYENVHYVYFHLANLSRDGGHFLIYKENHSKSILDKAVKQLKYNQDVVTYRLVDKEPTEWSKRFECMEINGT